LTFRRSTIAKMKLRRAKGGETWKVIRTA